LAAFFILISSVCAFEYSKLAQIYENIPLRMLCILGSIAFVLDAWLLKGVYSQAIIGAIFILSCFLQVFSGSTHRCIENISSTVFGVILCGWTFSKYYLIRSGFDGIILAFITVGIIWANDVGAYIIGSLFGKNKLAPSISPNKTVEGSIGGLIVSVVVCVIFKWLGNFLGLWSTLEWPLLIICAIVLACTGQIGDLAESAIKRSANVKDSGNILPGHGGMLDRFDSFALVAPVAYYFYLFLAKL